MFDVPNETFSPVPASAAAVFRGAGGFDFSWRRDLSAEQLHRLTYRMPRVLQWLAHGRLVLDSHAELPDERPRLRHRMAERAAAALHEIRPRAVSAQLHPVPAAAGTGLQHVHAAGRPRARGVAMDVAAADRLRFSAAGRQHRQRHFSRGLCAGGGGFRGARVAIAARGGFVAFDPRRRAADRRQGEQPAAAAAVGDFDFSARARCCAGNLPRLGWSSCLRRWFHFFPTPCLTRGIAATGRVPIWRTRGSAMKNPVVGVWGNGFQLVLDNFAPPIFPMAHWWNENAPSFMPHSLTAAADKYFDDGFFSLGELPTEDWAGIGFGLSVLLAVSVFAAWEFARHRAR